VSFFVLKRRKKMYNVCIIGAGVVGGMIARELSKYDVSVCIVEKANDVGMGTTKANSAIIHAGFDAEEGTLKAKLNVLGSQMMGDIAKQLGVKYKNNGSIVVGFSEDDVKTINGLYQRGVQNGVKDLKVLSGDEIRAIEPNISQKVIVALYAPTGAIICPYDLTVASIGNAMDNGAELIRNFTVCDIKEIDGGYEVISSEGQSVKAEYVINSAGLFADKIANMVGDNSFEIKPRRGEYILLDKECGQTVKSTIFRSPTKMGKGILVSPTVDGNLLLGPTAVNIEDKDDLTTTREGLDVILRQANEDVDHIACNKAITSFCGLRATVSGGDFIINSPKKGFINVAGIDSPGLSSAPAIAVMVKELIENQGAKLTEKANYISTRRSSHFFKELSIEEKNEIIKKDKSFGKIVCRCEVVTEGEILTAIRTNPKPLDLDGVKRRTRAQMGRCQGGFCSPYIMQLLAEELGVPVEQVTKKGKNSNVIIGKTKGEE
jgi:glycerol-3-phosphate dehydrogenase